MIKIRASSFERSANCPASNFGEQYSSPSSVYAIDGTNKHNQAREIHANLIVNNGLYINKGGEPFDGVVYDFAYYCYREGFNRWEETHEAIVTIDGHDIRISGHPDVYKVGISDDNKYVISILDFKSGYQDEDSLDNRQLLMYSYLLIKDARKKIPSDRKMDIKVEIAIFQNGIKTIYQYTEEDVIKAITQDLEYIVANKSLYVMGDHCKYCHKKHVCPLINKNVDELTTNNYDVASISNDDISDLADKLSLISGLKDAIYDEIKRRIAEGHPINGWSISKSYPMEFLHTPSGWAALLNEGAIDKPSFDKLFKGGVGALKALLKENGLPEEDYLRKSENPVIKIMKSKKTNH